MVCSGRGGKKQRIGPENFRNCPAPGAISLSELNGAVRMATEQQRRFPVRITTRPFLDNLRVIYTEPVFMPDAV